MGNKRGHFAKRRIGEKDKKEKARGIKNVFSSLALHGARDAKSESILFWRRIARVQRTLPIAFLECVFGVLGPHLKFLAPLNAYSSSKIQFFTRVFIFLSYPLKFL